MVADELSVAVASTPEPAPLDRLSRFASRASWLGRHRRWVIALIVVTITANLVVDIAVPTYPIAGFYLVPVTLAALTLRVRSTIAVSLLCLALSLWVMVAQGRTDGRTITWMCFTIFGGIALIALALLFRRVDELYETERATIRRLRALDEQLRTLQEVAVLDPERPLSDLLARVIEQAALVLGSDGARLYRLERGSGELLEAAATGWSPPADLASTARALEDRRPVASDGVAGDGAGAQLAVPLLVRDDPYGVLEFTYREPRVFSDVDVHLAASFGGQVALALENARLRAEVEQNAAAGERLRLARDLHDSVTQSLFAASLKAEAVRRRWRPSSAEARQNVEDVERLTHAALAEMRTLLLEMRPQALEGASLAALLEQLVAAAEGRLLIDVALTVSGAGSVALPPDVTVAMYRIAQEAINNVERHSRATTAWVRLEVEGDAVLLKVGDDGQGFSIGAVAPGHLGLDIMHERAEAAGLELAIESTGGRGTVVSALWRGPTGEGGEA
jgi:signal transduction histidine kinase